MSGTADPCPYCATPMANCAAPIWEDYCPNKECTGHRDEFMEEFRRGREAFAADQSMRDAAPDMYAACSDAFDFLGGVDEAGEIRAKLLAALARARGEKL
jgi:hypothetical protein